MSDTALSNTPRTHSTSARVLATGIFLALVLALIAVVTGGEDTPQPPQVVAAPVPGLTYTVAKDDEHLALIGKPYGVSRQEMIDANMSLIVTYTNTTCPALNRPATYFAGFLKDGKTHRDGTYCQFTMYEGANPAYKGKLLAQDSLKKGNSVIVPCTKASTPLIKACQTAVAKNVP